ncbi:MAG TPA: hypothetical protein VFW98_08810 [Gemmatimonadaceae bacterium]|nr:hypothetical protein [Gemmatimonadaceae bacterium]
MPDSIDTKDFSGALADETLEALRDALELELLASGYLHRALRNLSREAHAKSLQAEQVLVTLKQLWHSLPDVQRARTRAEQARALEHVIAMCITEYYET